MQAENKTNYFEHFIKNATEKDKEFIFQNFKLTGPHDNIDSYGDFGKLYNEFIEFWTNEEYLNTLIGIHQEVYNENTKKFKATKVDELLERYNNSDSATLCSMVHNVQDILREFRYIINRPDATQDEKKILEIHEEYSFRIPYLIYRINDAKKKNPEKPVCFNDLDIEEWTENDRVKTIHNHEYFQEFAKDKPEEAEEIFHDFQYNVTDYENYKKSYNKFIEFYSNQNNINTFQEIMEKIYDPENQKFKEDKLIEFLNEYNQNPSNPNVIDDYLEGQYGFHKIMERWNATSDEQKALNTYNEYFPILMLLYKIKKEKNMNPGQSVGLDNLNIPHLVEK